MREILFCGKRKDNGEWVEGFYCKHDTVKICFTTDNPKSKHLIIKDGFCDWGFEPPLKAYEVDPETVGQFINRTDINGEKLFEGYIVKAREKFSRKEFTGYIVCGDACFSVQDISSINKPAVDLVEDIEKIGNIYDNPELLKG